MVIEPETLMWGLTTILLLFTLCGIRYLIYMHNHSDRYGFGSAEIKDSIRENTIALNEMIRIARWWYTQYNDGQEIPPAPPQEVSTHEPPSKPAY